MDRFEIIAADLRGEDAQPKLKLDTHSAVPVGKHEWRPFRADGQVRSAHDLLAPAGLAWEPEFRPLYAQEGPKGQAGAIEKVDDWQAVCREDNGRLLGVVGKRYRITPNKALADLTDALAGASEGKLVYGNAGYFRGGARPFFQLESPARKVGGLDFLSKASVFTAHDGSLNTTAGFSNVCIVCRNTYQNALRDAKNAYQIRHTASSDARIKEIIKILDLFHKYEIAFDNTTLRLMSTKITTDNYVGLTEKLVPGDSTRAKNIREALLEAYYKAPGAAVGTAFGAAQAITFYTTHERSTRGGERSEAEARAESSWWGSGKNMVETAWWTLTNEDEIHTLKPELQTVKVLRA